MAAPRRILRRAPRLVAAAALACALVATSGCGGDRGGRSALERDLARRGLELVRTGPNGLVHWRRPDGDEFWADEQDRRAGRVHVKPRGGAPRLLYDAPDRAPRELPPGETEMLVDGGGLLHRPDWLPLYPGSSAEPAFASYTPGGVVAGSWVLETPDAPEAVRGFYADALRQAGHELREAPPLRPGPEVIAYYRAGDPHGTPYVGLRFDRPAGPGARAEVYYRIRR